MKSLDSLWHYVIGCDDARTVAWIRLVDRGSSNRIERCQTDERWRCYQSATFSGRVAVERVHGSHGRVAPENALGSVLSLLAASSNLRDPGEEQTPRELVLSDFSRCAEVIAANPHLLRSYRRRRDAARGRYWVALRELKGAS